MEIAHAGANAMRGYSGPRTSKQQSEMAAKYGPAPKGKELYTITKGKAVYKTKEEIAALDKNIPDYSNPNDRAEINHNLREAIRQAYEREQQQAESDARYLKKLKGSDEKPRTSASQDVPSVDITRASSTKAATTAPKSMTDALGGLAPTNIKPAFDVKSLKNMQDSEPSGTSGNPMMDILNSDSDISDGDQSTAFSDFNYLSRLKNKKKTPWYVQYGNTRPKGFGYPA